MNINYRNSQYCPDDKFDVVRPLWNELKLKAVSSSPFMDPDRYVVTAPRYNGFERFHVDIGCDESGLPHYLAAFFVQSRPFMFQLGAKIFSRPRLKTRFLSTFSEGVAWTSSTGMEALASHIVACLSRKTIDGLYFQYMVEEDALKIFALLRQKKLLYVITSSSRNWIVTLDNKHLPEPIMRLSSTTRKSLKRKEKKLTNDYNGNIVYHLVTSESQIENFFYSVEKIAENSWQRKQKMGIYDNDNWRAIFTIEANNNRLRCYVLTVNNVPISYQFGSIYNNVYNAEATAYDQRYSKYGPGMLIFKHALSDLYNIEVKEVDLGGGEEKYKVQWGTYSKPMISFEVYGRSPFSIILWTLRKSNNIIESLTKKILLRMGLLKKINKWHQKKTRRI